MIKTDKVVYRTRTLEEYDWLMEKLKEAGCPWADGSLATEHQSYWENFFEDTCISVDDGKIRFTLIDYETIEVSDLMENEEKTITDEPTEQVDKPKKIKKIIYTTEVYFE